MRKKLKSKSKKAIGECLPKTSVIESHIPAYKPSPIETVDKRENNLSPNDVPKRGNKLSPNGMKPVIEKKSSYKTMRKKLKSKSKKAIGECLPKTSVIESHIPAYKPSPIETIDKRENKLSPNDVPKRGNKLSPNGMKPVIEKKSSYKTMRKKLKSKSKKAIGECLPKTSAIESHIPAYKPSPIETVDKRENKLSPNDVPKSNEGEEAIKSYENKFLNKPEDVHNSLLYICSVRRSDRLKAKPKRFIEEREKYECSKKLKKGTSLPLSATHSAASKKKRYRDNCEQEKAGKPKWLAKKNSCKTTGSKDISKKGYRKDISKAKSSSSKSSKENTSKKLTSSKDEKKESTRSSFPESMDIVMPSKEELEIMRTKHKMQREENEKIKAILEKINTPAPKKVEFLSLRDMSLNELLDSYPSYREELDKVFEKNCNKNHVEGHDGINHCVVIGLIDQQLQLKMMQRLTDVYSSNTNHTIHATLYANALLPEWIVRIFMKRYNLNRCQAIQQIQDQDTYESYMEDQNESFLRFDYSEQ